MPLKRARLMLLAALVLVACQDQSAPEPDGIAPVAADGSLHRTGHLPGDPRPHCREQTIPVALGPGQPAQYTIYGQLCMPAGANPHRVPTVHLAVHGATYSHLYNAWPYQPRRYSYADALMKAGYAVFTFDRIGIGRSSHPAGALVTIPANAHVVHQLVQGLRDGTIGRTAFQRVVLVGHSLGSITSLLEASTYGDVDGVVLTGFSHALAAGDIGDITSQFVLANQDPRFAGMNLDDDYLTTAPGSRLSLFYYPPNTDLKVVELDEATKETATTGELQSVGTAFTPEASLAIRVPVFVVNGQFDQLVCGAGFSVCASAASLAATEAPFFAPEACLQTFVNPATGHDLNLEPTAPSTYAAIRAWSDAFVGLNHAAPACS